MLNILAIFAIAFAGLFFFSAFRAMRFAARHKDWLPGVMDRTTWWLRLFKGNGYGEDLEEERRRLARWCLVTAVLFFATAGVIVAQAPPPAP